jgi:hypothetical protein
VPIVEAWLKVGEWNKYRHLAVEYRCEDGVTRRLELWAFDWAYGGCKPPAPANLRFDVQAVSIFSRSSLSRDVDLGCQTACYIGDLRFKRTAEFVSGAPARRGWRVDNQFRRD